MSTERAPPRKFEDLQKEGSIELLKQLLATLHRDYVLEYDDHEKYKDFSVHPAETSNILGIIKYDIRFHDYNKIYSYLTYCEELILTLDDIKKSLTDGMKTMISRNHLTNKDGLISFSTDVNLDN